MADQVNVTGLVLVKVQLAAGAGQLVKFGESMDMVDVEERAFFHNVPGDSRGGPQGPPIEVQWLGQLAIIRFELSKCDPTVFDNVRKRRAVTTAGAQASTDVGKLMLASNPVRLLLHSPTRPLNFPCCVVREAIQFGMGTKFSGFAFQFEAHAAPAGAWVNEGILYNSELTEYTS